MRGDRLGFHTSREKRERFGALFLKESPEPDKTERSRTPLTVQVDSLGGLQRITLDSGVVRAALLPELGGKMISLMRLATGSEFLLPPPEPERGYRRPVHDAIFKDYDTSGFDECIATVSACAYPVGDFCGRQMPDHGELWYVPWQYEIASEEVHLSAHGSCLPYILRKWLRLRESAVVIDYELCNLGKAAFRFLWSAHPLLKVEAGARILLPREISELFIGWSNGNRLGISGESCTFPVVRRNRETDDLSFIKPPGKGTADKLFTPRLHAGFCGLYRPELDESIVFRFDPEVVPYVGLWICQGGWPLSREIKHFTVALEPCNAPSDSLAEVIAMGACPTLPPGGSIAWSVSIELCSGVAHSEPRPSQ